MSGCEQHDIYCRSARSLGDASVAGSLYLHPDGYPLLVVPPGAVLATGSRDLARDLAQQEAIESERAGRADDVADTELAHGELLSFDGNPSAAIAAIDDYEDFEPGGNSVFVRSLVALAGSAAPRSAWAYVASSDLPLDRVTPLPQRRWRPK